MNAYTHPDFTLVTQNTPRRQISLGLLTPHNPFDRSSFSGTAHHAVAALGRLSGVSLRILGPHRKPRRLDRFFGRPSVPKDLAGIDLRGLDGVIGLTATGLLDSLHRKCGLPFFHISDATPGFLRDTYGWDIPSSSDLDEARVSKNAAATIYSSTFMAQRASAEMGSSPGKLHAVPFGVNLTGLPKIRPPKTPLDPINLLFVGIDWTRKGGDLALSALDCMRNRGVNARLTVVGPIPDAVRRHPAVNAVGFLDKNRPSNRRHLSDLYAQAHLLVLPTRGDCTPMVLAEAMAHGTPVIATDVGGVGEIVGPQNGAGRCMKITDSAQDWAHAIQDLCQSPDCYEKLSAAAFRRAQDRFSWDAWANDIETIARQALSPRSSTPRMKALSSG